MKRILIFLLTIITVFSFSGCSLIWIMGYSCKGDLPIVINQIRVYDEIGQEIVGQEYSELEELNRQYKKTSGRKGAKIRQNNSAAPLYLNYVVESEYGATVTVEYYISVEGNKGLSEILLTNEEHSYSYSNHEYSVTEITQVSRGEFVARFTYKVEEDKEFLRVIGWKDKNGTQSGMPGRGGEVYRYCVYFKTPGSFYYPTTLKDVMQNSNVDGVTSIRFSSFNASDNLPYKKCYTYSDKDVIATLIDQLYNTKARYIRDYIPTEYQTVTTVELKIDAYNFYVYSHEFKDNYYTYSNGQVWMVKNAPDFNKELASFESYTFISPEYYDVYVCQTNEKLGFAEVNCFEFVEYDGIIPEDLPTFYIDIGRFTIYVLTEDLFYLQNQAGEKTYYKIISGINFEGFFIRVD